MHGTVSTLYFSYYNTVWTLLQVFWNKCKLTKNTQIPCNSIYFKIQFTVYLLLYWSIWICVACMCILLSRHNKQKRGCLKQLTGHCQVSKSWLTDNPDTTSTPFLNLFILPLVFFFNENKSLIYSLLVRNSVR